MAQTVLEEPAGRLRAILPLELDDYRRDFSEPQWARFQSLLNRADEIIFPQPVARGVRGKAAPVATPAEFRLASYERVGFAVVEQSDVIIAIWDGEPARGRGGTGDIVQRARRLARPLIWIQSRPPYVITAENLDRLLAAPGPVG